MKIIIILACLLLVGCQPDITEDSYIQWYMASHSILISWGKWLVIAFLTLLGGGSVTAGIAKIVAITNINTPTNTIKELIENTTGTKKIPPIPAKPE